MKKLLGLLAMSLVLAMSGAEALAQEHGHGAKEEKNSMGEKAHRSEQNKPVDLKTGDKITRGAALSGTAKKVSLAKAMKSPDKYAGQTVLVEGVIVRACKIEGCWLELAPKDGAKGIRVKMKDHGFFVPLNSAGLTAKVEGTMSVKTLSKAEVDHLVNDDGAKFDNINPDGTVTEISFLASGVELTKK